MGAPGLDFETWDPSRKCRQTNLESFDQIEFRLLTPAGRVGSKPRRVPGAAESLQEASSWVSLDPPRHILVE
jgi:hypothetical protein